MPTFKRNEDTNKHGSLKPSSSRNNQNFGDISVSEFTSDQGFRKSHLYGY